MKLGPDTNVMRESELAGGSHAWGGGMLQGSLVLSACSPPTLSFGFRHLTDEPLLVKGFRLSGETLPE